MRSTVHIPPHRLTSQVADELAWSPAGVVPWQVQRSGAEDTAHAIPAWSVPDVADNLRVLDLGLLG